MKESELYPCLCDMFLFLFFYVSVIITLHSLNVSVFLGLVLILVVLHFLGETHVVSKMMMPATSPLLSLLSSTFQMATDPISQVSYRGLKLNLPKLNVL